MISRLLPLSGEPKKRKLVGFDTEDNSQGRPLQLVFVDAGGSMRFEHPRDALGWLATRKVKLKTIVCATQLEYDIVNLVKEGGIEHLHLGYSAGASKLVWARVLKTRLAMLDTLNYVPLGVAKLGDSIGLPKLDFAPNDPEYCIRDATIVYQFMGKLQDELNDLGGELKYTAGGTALDLWRRKFQPFVIEPTDPAMLDWLQTVNYGGRVEVFTRAKVHGRIIYDDVNSLYPFVLASYDYPNPNTLTRRVPELHELGVIDCTVRVPADCYLPVLPCRAKLESGAKLIFPVGTFRGKWTTAELQYAVHMGAASIERVHGGVAYEDRGSYFSEYVRTLYPLRPRDGSPRDFAIKLLLNALFGKFGQRNITTEMVRLEDAKNPCGRRVFQGYVFEDVIGEYPPHACQIWAGWTLARARVHLHWLMSLVLQRGGELHYCDTDSIIYSGCDPLPTGDQLGDLKRVGIFNQGEFIAPKIYALRSPQGDKIVSKGVPVGSAESFIERGMAEWLAPLRLREGGDRANVWTRHERRRLSAYDKRLVTADGRTRPLTVKGDAP